MKLSMFLTRTLTALTCAALVTLSSGCFLVAVGAAGAAGAGAVAYVRGELDATLANKYDATVAASNKAIEALQFAKVSEKKDAFSAVITARTAQDKKVQITVTKSTDTLSRVQIRVGTFGDEGMSMSILDKIKANNS
jgi:hypothetical protein